ncbi:MAG: sodium:proton antiporter [Candidatus Zixiibacteriota bacterium]
MTHLGFDSPAVTIALALAVGLVVQILAHHARLPGIVLLLAAGALLGPDVADIVKPQMLGPALRILVGFAVAVVLFEGGLNLNIARLRHESGVIQSLVTLGGVITGIGGTVAARMVLGWDWGLAALFGSLVIVTGPTVIAPLVRRIRLNRNLQTILEAEGVMIDPIGAIIAVVVLEIVVSPTATSFASGLLHLFAKLGIGALLGAVAGMIMTLALRARHLIPEGLENVLTLALVLATFHLSDAAQTESGIVAVTVAGMVVANSKSRVLRDLMEFKEQLTTLFIGMLFVLLAADVRFAQVQSLGIPGLITVAILMFIVRPVNVLASTFRSRLKWREKAFLCWLAPRGIVAAAVASFFAEELALVGRPGGEDLRALTFLVIAITVLVQGLTGGPLAGLLGVQRKARSGVFILGADEFARVLAGALRDAGIEVTMLDSNRDHVNDAGDAGYRVYYGNGLQVSTLERVNLDSIATVVGLTTNEEVNQIFVRRAREHFKVPRTLTVLGGHVTTQMISDADAHIVFGHEHDPSIWSYRVRNNTAVVEQWTLTSRADDDESAALVADKLAGDAYLPLLLQRGKSTQIIDETTTLRNGDRVTLIIHRDKYDDVAEALRASGWTRNDPEHASVPEERA